MRYKIEVYYDPGHEDWGRYDGSYYCRSRWLVDAFKRAFKNKFDDEYYFVVRVVR